MRLMLDSNVYVSFFISSRKGGVAYDLLSLIADLKLKIFTSEFIFKEINRVLGYARLQKSLNYDAKDVEKFFEVLLNDNDIVFVTDLPTIDIVRDKNDNPVLATALKANADYLVTRDKDLLVLNPYEKIKIITPEHCLEILRVLP